MFKKWFQPTAEADAEFEGQAHRGGYVGSAAGPAEAPREPELVRELVTTMAQPEIAMASATGKYAPFDEIYRNGQVKPPKVTYGILKVAEMVASPHLTGMSAEAKRASLLMALDAAGVQLEDLLQDAMVRQRALNEYEDGQYKRLKEFEAQKAKENEA